MNSHIVDDEYHPSENVHARILIHTIIKEHRQLATFAKTYS